MGFYSLDVFSLEDVISDTSFDRMTVEDIDNRIAEHEAQIDILRTLMIKHQRAIAKYQGHRNTLTDTITSKLPVEIFSDILLRYGLMCRKRKEYFDDETPYLWLKLAHVSRRWRNVVFSLPSLFSYIRVGGIKSHNVDSARNFLHFSGQRAIHLDTLLRAGSRDDPDLLKLLSDHAHRIETMESNPLPLIELYHRMTNIRSLVIGSGWTSWSRTFLKDPLPSSLTRLIFADVFPSTSPQEFLRAVGGLTNLQELLVAWPSLPSTWNGTPQSPMTIRPLKTVVLTGSLIDVCRLLPYLAVASDGSLCIEVKSQKVVDDLWYIFRLIHAKLFDVSSPDPPHSMRLSSHDTGCIEYYIGALEALRQELPDEGSRFRTIINLDDPPILWPRLYFHLNIPGRSHDASLLHMMERIEQEPSTSYSVTTHLILDLDELDRNAVKMLLERGKNLSIIELFCRRDFFHVARTIYGWFVDASGTPTQAFPLLHTLIISRAYGYFDPRLSTLYDALRIRKEGGLEIQTLVMDLSASYTEFTPDVEEMVEMLRDVVLEFQYLPPTPEESIELALDTLDDLV